MFFSPYQLITAALFLLQGSSLQSSMAQLENQLYKKKLLRIFFFVILRLAEKTYISIVLLATILGCFQPGGREFNSQTEHFSSILFSIGVQYSIRVVQQYLKQIDYFLELLLCSVHIILEQLERKCKDYYNLTL